jgi:hypothetical protein
MDVSDVLVIVIGVGIIVVAGVAATGYFMRKNKDGV